MEAAFMWVGFAIRHVGKKLAIASTVAAGAVLSTESGRRVAKVIWESLKRAGGAAAKEIKAQTATKTQDHRS